MNDRLALVGLAAGGLVLIVPALCGAGEAPAPAACKAASVPEEEKRKLLEAEKPAAQ
jgi:hypothetical protein